jgi:nitronate monooxygenase
MAAQQDRLRELLGTELPIVQAPMAGVQGSALAIAVSNAGGLGSLPCGMLAPDDVRSEVTRIAAQTSKPYNVNFLCHTPPPFDPERDASWRRVLSPYYQELGVDPPPLGPSALARAPFDDDAVELITALKPPIVSFHYGLPPARLLARVKAWHPVVMSSATTVDEAIWLEEHGADVIIAQGLEAGGHRGMFLVDALTTQLGTFALVPQIVRTVRVPVLAAGGIADAAGVVAALSLGAAGVQVGTSYLLCPETTTSPLHRAALASPAASHTAVTNVFTGRPARAIVNRLIAEIGPMNRGAPPFPLATPAFMPLRAHAEARGSSDFSFLLAGQNTMGCQQRPAADMTKELASRL